MWAIVAEIAASIIVLWQIQLYSAEQDAIVLEHISIATSTRKSGVDASIHSTSSGQTPLSTSTSGWKTYQDDKLGFEMKYPETLNSYFIRTWEWPPKLSKSSSPFQCENHTMTAKEIVINNHKYCLLTTEDSGMSHHGVTYLYTNQAFSLQFSLIYTSCDVYDPEPAIICKAEQNGFNPNLLADQIFSTISTVR